MEVERESLKLNLSNELTETAHLLSMEAHKHNQPYITNTVDHVTASSSSSSLSMEVFIFAFPGAWGVNDWYQDDLFGEIDVDCNLFPSLRRIGENRLAQVNAAFLHRFQDLLNNSMFKPELEKAVKGDKKILFTGHSSGGATASFATLWMLDEYVKKRKISIPIGCVTFGSPLIGDRTLSHAVRREKWAGHFTHVVMEHDIVPRMMLAPKSAIQEHLPNILKFFQERLNPTNHESTSEGTVDQYPIEEEQAVEFFENVMTNASSVTSHVAFNVMEPMNFLMDKLWTDFVKISPYRPSGYYVFRNRDETLGPDAPLQQFVVENPNAVLQLLFYFLQLTDESQLVSDFVVNSITESLSYKDVQTENLVDLISLNDDLWTPNGATGDAVHTISKALFDLSVSARCGQMAVYEAEKRKIENENGHDMSMRRYRQDQSRSDRSRTESKIIEDILDDIRNYKVNHEDYYESFKLQDEREDFMANVKRLELAKRWDTIVEMVMHEDLPDEFEGRGEWVEVGTVFRRLVEPLDIANYYRFLRGGGYMYVRPKRYKFTQRWYEHANGTVFELLSESNFVARFEEIRKEIEERRTKAVEEVQEELESVEERIAEWFSDEKIRNEDVFWGESLLSMLQQLLQQQQQHQEEEQEEEEEEEEQQQEEEEQQEEQPQPQPQPQQWILFE